MSVTAPAPSPLPVSRNAVIIGSVVVMHGVALWALNNGLLQRAIEVVVPAEILAEFIAPPPPPAAPPPPSPAVQPPPPEPVKPRVAPPPKPRPAPRPAQAPTPLAVQEAAPTAPVMAAAPTPPAPVPAPPPPAPPAPPAPAPEVVVQPSSNATYLNNPKPAYPAASRRLGETGRVIIRVLIGTDGRAQEARIQRSSGFDRLDQVALEPARDRWRYRPGTRNGVPEPMWFNVPINFELTE